MHTFQEILGKVKEIKAGEIRVDLPAMLECMVRREDLPRLTAILELYFGPPAKPSGAIPNSKLLIYTDPYGSIRRDQILYFKESKEEFDCAMLWPWLDGMMLTVKVFHGNKKEIEALSKSPWKKIKKFFQKQT